MIHYDHSKAAHSLQGPRAALPILLQGMEIHSLLDVGCGTGTWLKAAMQSGIVDVYGVDGVEIPSRRLHFPPTRFLHQDLTRPWDLHRRFDAVLCLEVAEHLEAAHAPILMDALAKHADVIFFSAACPQQPGQNHINCQWPGYWQMLFNERGFACWDDVRWRIWDDSRVEPWYRQNVFVARRDQTSAGHEPRIKAVLHPDMYALVDTINAISGETFDDHVANIERGQMPAMWYSSAPVRALFWKLQRRFSKLHS